MTQKILWLSIIWFSVIIAYLLLAWLMPMYRDIVDATLISMNATANMTQQPGAYDAVASAPVWLWFIPGPVGIVTTVVMLKTGRD